MAIMSGQREHERMDKRLMFDLKNKHFFKGNVLFIGQS